MSVSQGLIFLGVVTIVCLIYHVYYFNYADRIYEECEKRCDDGTDKPCRESTTDTNMDCGSYYQCIDKCKG